jgi:hypothetical protein
MLAVAERLNETDAGERAVCHVGEEPAVLAKVGGLVGRVILGIGEISKGATVEGRGVFVARAHVPSPTDAGGVEQVADVGMRLRRWRA